MRFFFFNGVRRREMSPDFPLANFSGTSAALTDFSEFKTSVLIKINFALKISNLVKKNFFQRYPEPLI